MISEGRDSRFRALISLRAYPDGHRQAGMGENGGRKGFFSIFALWTLILLVLFCSGLGFRAFVQVKKTKLFLNRRRAFNLAVSGIKMARAVLAKDLNETQNGQPCKEDYLQEEWALPIEKGALSVKIEDETGRLNINSVADSFIEEARLIKLFEEVQAAAPAQRTANILEYIRSEDLKNEKLSVVEELFLTEEFSKRDYDGVKDLVTVFGEGKLNINTVKEQVLDVLIDDEALKERILRRRFGPNLTAGDGDDGYYSLQDLDDLKKDYVLNTEIALQIDRFDVQSRIFRVLSEIEVEGVTQKITSVIDREQNKVLYWYEK